MKIVLDGAVTKIVQASPVTTQEVKVSSQVTQYSPGPRGPRGLTGLTGATGPQGDEAPDLMLPDLVLIFENKLV